MAKAAADNWVVNTTDMDKGVAHIVAEKSVTDENPDCLEELKSGVWTNGFTEGIGKCLAEYDNIGESVPLLSLKQYHLYHSISTKIISESVPQLALNRYHF